MAYSQKIIDEVAKTPKSLGNQLGRWAIHLDFPVTKIAYALGVSRQTVYNWFSGASKPQKRLIADIQRIIEKLSNA